MSASEPEHSPLARFVLFMVCLAIAGTFISVAHYYTVDLPQHQIQEPPKNNQKQWDDCIAFCADKVDRKYCWERCMNMTHFD